MNLALVGTPGHYYNLLNCIDQLNVDSKATKLILFYLKDDFQTTEFYRNSIDKELWKEVVLIRVWNSSNNFFMVALLLIIIKRRMSDFLNEKYSFLFVCQYNAIYSKHILNNVDADEYIALDEGNAVLNQVIEREKSIKNPVKRKRHQLLGLDNSEIEKLTYFTSYDLDVLPQDKVIKCEYSYSRRLVNAKNVDQTATIIVGSPYVEDKIIDASVYRKLLPSITEYADTNQTLYVPHRRESNQNLDYYKNHLGFKILKLDIPLELYIQQVEEIPAQIIGFYSAAILNIKSFVDKEQVRILSFELPSKDILRKDIVQNIEAVYDSYRSLGVEVVLCDQYVNANVKID